jgi:chromate transporter
MNVLVLYLILLKATVTTFSGLASLPLVRDELVVNRQVLTDEQLNTAVVVTRTTPGPIGLYVVSVGYFAAGVPGAAAGWLAMSTPALAILLLLRFIGRWAESSRIKQILESVVVASAGLLFSAAIPLARGSLTDLTTVVIAAATVILMITKKADSLIIIGGSSPLDAGCGRTTDIPLRVEGSFLEMRYPH